MKYKQLQHLQQHNAWPFGWATFLWIVGMIFLSGQIYNRFTNLEENFKDYRNATQVEIQKLQESNENAYRRLDQYEPRVKGVATGSATLKVTVTPTPTAKPKPSPVKPSPTH